MSEIKDKIITVESLKSLHDYNTETYETRENVENALDTKFDKPTDNIIPIINGGTGANTIEKILENLGIASYIVETGNSGGWNFTKWSDGSIELWVHHENTTDNVETTINLPFEMVDDMYFVCPVICREGSIVDKFWLGGMSGTYERTTSSFKYFIKRIEGYTTYAVGIDFFIKGYYK